MYCVNEDQSHSSASRIVALLSSSSGFSTAAMFSGIVLPTKCLSRTLESSIMPSTRPNHPLHRNTCVARFLTHPGICSRHRLTPRPPPLEFSQVRIRSITLIRDVFGSWLRAIRFDFYPFECQQPCLYVPTKV
jgi:hypothetical protein